MVGMTATTESAGLPPGPLTVADLEGMPDDGHRYELPGGVLVLSPAPSPVHQRAVLRILLALTEAAPPNIEALPAPLAFRPQGRLPLGEQVTELQPDVVVTRREDWSARDLPVPPLLAVEVLSPSTRLFDPNLKRAAYERMGVSSYWLVDPERVELVAFEAGADGRCTEVARVRDQERFETDRPFEVTVCPAHLVAGR